MLKVVNQVMAQMFFLLPDLDDHGLQLIGVDTPQKGKVVHLKVDDHTRLQFIFEQGLLTLMTSYLTALPPDEVPLDWSRQIPLEAVEVCWGRYLTIHDKKSMYRFHKPQRADRIEDTSEARWKLSYISESHQLNVALFNK